MNGYNSMTYAGDYLEHHGIKGQHWGERRFQDEQGRWTELGRQRYGKGGGAKGLSIDYVREHEDYKDPGFHLSMIPKSKATKQLIKEKYTTKAKAVGLAGTAGATTVAAAAMALGVASVPISGVPASTAASVAGVAALAQAFGSMRMSKIAGRYNEAINESRAADKREYVKKLNEELEAKAQAKAEAKAAKKQAKLDAKEQKKRDKWLQKFEEEEYEFGGLVEPDDAAHIRKMHHDGASIEELNAYCEKAWDRHAKEVDKLIAQRKASAADFNGDTANDYAKRLNAESERRQEGHGVKGMSPEQRMRAIRLMEKMERSGNTERNADGSMVWKDRDGNPLITARMEDKKKRR